MTTSYIYAIWFPDANDNSVYIGLTNNPPKRFGEHRSTMKRNNKRTVYKWMRERVECGFEPEFLILEECNDETADAKEIAWQQIFREWKWIPKYQRGGARQIGCIFTDEHKDKLSLAAKSRPRRILSEVTKRKISAAWTKERKELQGLLNKEEGKRLKQSETLKSKYASGERKSSKGSNPKVSSWTCKCGKIMKATSKGMHRKACYGTIS